MGSGWQADSSTSGSSSTGHLPGFLALKVLTISGRQVLDATRFQPSRRSRAKETVVGDSCLSGEHGVSASLTTEVTRSIDGLPERFKALSELENPGNSRPGFYSLRPTSSRLGPASSRRSIHTSCETANLPHHS